MHIKRIINNKNKDPCDKINKANTPTVICDSIKNMHKKLINSSILDNKVHTENNNMDMQANNTIKELFNNVPKQIVQCNNVIDKLKIIDGKLFDNVLRQINHVNKVHTQTNNAFFDFDIRKKLFNNVLSQLVSNNKQKNAGHKDSSANIITEVHTRDINNDVLLHNHILYHTNKINNMHKCISNNHADIASTLNNIYCNDIDTKFNKLKSANDKLNILINGLDKYMFNKVVFKENIILDAKTSINIKKYTPLVDNKYICISEINEYLSDNISDMYNNIKNEKYNEVLTCMKLIRGLSSIKRMHIHKKTNNTNKKNK